ncbi:MAG TPA: AAA family ATPase, partial [Ramlibacter sp.]|nr:AAA family ATPase [Ramlibacter sp.]
QLVATAHPPTVIAMEDCSGPLLAQAIQAEQPALPMLLDTALQLAQITAAMHERGVLHRNINPGHILLCGPRLRPVLIDFHLATTVAEGRPDFTHHRAIAGELAYLAPEQTGRTGRGVDHRADLYALGATLYELAAGRPPFEAADPLQLIHDLLARQPEPPAALRPGLPKMLSDIILRLLEKEPDRRYQSADGLAWDLARLRERHARDDDQPFPLGERDFPLRLAPPSRLVGRESELSVIRRALDEAIEGRQRLLLVGGDAGVGKTSLINALRPMVSAVRGWFVSGKFDQYRRDAPTATVQALRGLARLLLAEPPAQLAEQRERLLARLGPNAGLIAAMMPEFATVLGTEPELASGDPVMAEARLRLAVLELLRAVVSPARPLVMVLDDLQWAGPMTIRFIASALAGDKLHGLLLVGAYRQDEVELANPLSAVLSRWQQLGAVALVLRNLPPSGMSELLGEMLRLPQEQATALAQVMGTRTGGNPFDTLELVNALRRDGLLVPGANGWEWDSSEIRRYVGSGDVVDLLEARIAQLPPAGRQVLEAVACLGGEVRLELLRAATGLGQAELEARLAAPLEEGLLVLGQPEDGTVHLRHDRVQQVVYATLPEFQRNALHLALARRLVRHGQWRLVAAQQYFAAVDAVREPRECRRAARLLHEVTAQVGRTANHAAMERLLAAGISLLSRVLPATSADEQLLAALEIERHALLCSLGRLDDADEVYRTIEARHGNLLALVGAACAQVSSLNIRGRRREAVDMGLQLLRQLGLKPPEPSAAGGIHQGLDEVHRWVAQYDLAFDRARPQVSDPRVVAAAQLINQLQVPAFYCDTPIAVWSIQESQRLWAEHGPCAALVANLGRAALVSISINQDYRTSAETLRHVLAAGEARGYEPETSQVRHLFAVSAAHWFEPLEDCIAQAQRAREGLLLGGDLQNACTSYHASLRALPECAPTLDAYAAEIDAGLAFAARLGNEQANAVMVPDRQLLRALRGETDAPSSLTEGGIDKKDYLDSLASHPVALANFHVRRSLGAALFADTPTLQRHAEQVMPLMSFIQSFYIAALAYLLRALAQAERVKAAPAQERQAPLAELDACRQWLAERATDAPANFLHLLKWIDAERAWAVGDFGEGVRRFDAALRETGAQRRPWHQALITERAGLFHLAHGVACVGEMLLAQARHLYHAWGASAKVRQLDQVHEFLQAPATMHVPAAGRGDSLSADTIDTLAVLRASQALSSETNLARLKARVVDLLGTLTGATSVQFVLWSEDAKDWFASVAQDDTPVPVEEAGRRG